MKTIDVPSSFLLLLSSSSTSSSTTSTSGPPRSHRLLNLPTKTTATSYISLYNSLMKLVFLASSAAILYLMRGAKGIRQTYDAAHDTFRVAFLVAPAALLALWLSADRSSAMETAWTFSILLEAVAILPQLVLLQRTGNVDNLTGDYVFLLGTYRGLYVVNWFYRWMTEPGYKQWLGELVVWEREGGRGGGGRFLFLFFFCAPRLLLSSLLSFSPFFFLSKKKTPKKNHNQCGSPGPSRRACTSTSSTTTSARGGTTRSSAFPAEKERGKEKKTSWKRKKEKNDRESAFSPFILMQDN